MEKMFERERSPAEYAQDNVSFVRWLNAANDVPDENRSYALKLLGKALREELTESQLRYITKYYVDELTVNEIGEMFGVNQSTVSRGISQAKRRIERVLRYCSPAFLRDSLNEEPVLKRERRTRRKNNKRSG